MKILVFDNYDSFTYNLVHYLEEITGNPVDVFRNDQIPLEEIEKYDKILLSPGPGLPDESGLLLPLIKEYAGKKSILGICLGLQAIAQTFGGNLKNLPMVQHGIASNINVLKKDEPLFRGIPSQFLGGRYHSWIVDKEGLPEVLDITCEDEKGMIMGLTHQTFDLAGLQFHPESILTPHGKTMLINWLKK